MPIDDEIVNWILLAKGDVAGHDFHGNQWVAGIHGDGNKWLQERLTGFAWNTNVNGNSQGVTPKQAEALRRYYQNQKDINSGNDTPTARLITNAIEKNTASKAITTFRGVSWQDGQELRNSVGNRNFSKLGFLSSSISPNVAKRFSDADILMKITIPEGSHCVGILGNESEVILPENAKFSVDAISEVELADGTKFPVAECTYQVYWKKGEGIVKSQVQKGDVAGHEFHGNQWVEGIPSGCTWLAPEGLSFIGSKDLNNNKQLIYETPKGNRVYIPWSSSLDNNPSAWKPSDERIGYLTKSLDTLNQSGGLSIHCLEPDESLGKGSDSTARLERNLSDEAKQNNFGEFSITLANKDTYLRNEQQDISMANAGASPDDFNSTSGVREYWINHWTASNVSTNPQEVAQSVIAHEMGHYEFERDVEVTYDAKDGTKFATENLYKLVPVMTQMAQSAISGLQQRGQEPNVDDDEGEAFSVYEKMTDPSYWTNRFAEAQKTEWGYFGAGVWSYGGGFNLNERTMLQDAGMSEYGSTNPAEFIAETYSMATNPKIDNSFYRPVAVTAMQSAFPRWQNAPVFPIAKSLVQKGDIEGHAFHGNQYETVAGGGEDYHYQHRAPSNNGDDAPLHALDKIFPPDIYSNKAIQYYGTGDDKADRESMKVINAVRGNPDAVVTVYRGVPKGVNVINDGDWVTLSKTYAEQHVESNIQGEGHVISMQVPARTIFTDANSINEFGYDPSGAVQKGDVAGHPFHGNQYETGESGEAFEKAKDFISNNVFKTASIEGSEWSNYTINSGEKEKYTENLSKIVSNPEGFKKALAEFPTNGNPDPAKAVMAMLGNLGKPSVISEAEFAKGDEYQRLFTGLSAPVGKGAEVVAGFAHSDNPTYGGGIYGTAFYTSELPNEALEYANERGGDRDHMLLQMRLDWSNPDASNAGSGRSVNYNFSKETNFNDLLKQNGFDKQTADLLTEGLNETPSDALSGYKYTNSGYVRVYDRSILQMSDTYASWGETAPTATGDQIFANQKVNTDTGVSAETINRSLAKGDKLGHDFRGNQYVQGVGSTNGALMQGDQIKSAIYSEQGINAFNRIITKRGYLGYPNNKPMYGGCGIVAKALLQIYPNGKMVAIGDPIKPEEGRDYPPVFVQHYAVQIGEDKFVDANGERSLQGIKDDAGEMSFTKYWEVVPATPDLISKFGSIATCTDQEAKDYANSLLEASGSQHIIKGDVAGHEFHGNQYEQVGSANAPKVLYHGSPADPAKLMSQGIKGSKSRLGGSKGSGIKYVSMTDNPNLARGFGKNVLTVDPTGMKFLDFKNAFTIGRSEPTWAGEVQAIRNLGLPDYATRAILQSKENGGEIALGNKEFRSALKADGYDGVTFDSPDASGATTQGAKEYRIFSDIKPAQITGTQDVVAKGDKKGHEFHGNQYEAGEAGGGWKALTPHEYAQSLVDERLGMIERACKGESAEFRARITPIILGGDTPEAVLREETQRAEGAKTFKLDGSKTTLIVRNEAGLSADQIKGIATQLGNLSKSFPNTVDTLLIGKDLPFIPKSPSGGQSGGATLGNQIYMNTIDTADKTMDDMASRGWAPKSSAGTSALDYTVIHEFGHALMNANPYGDKTFSPETETALKDNPVPSTYSLSNDLEAYAECFADYVCSKGASTEPMTTAIAKSENWKARLGY